jgi:hypothetical protein
MNRGHLIAIENNKEVVTVLPTGDERRISAVQHMSRAQF